MKSSFRNLREYVVYAALYWRSCSSLSSGIRPAAPCGNGEGRVAAAAGQCEACRYPDLCRADKDYAPFLKLQTLKLEEAKKKLPETVTVPELVSEYASLRPDGLSLDSLKPLRK